MNLFFVIGVGAGSEELDPDVARFVVEVRVEEELSKPTRYAIRFEETVCEGSFTTSNVEKLRPGMTLAVLVKEREEDDRLQCLVRGPITRVKTSAVAVAGPSFYEVTGEDERVLLARDSIQAEYVGRASQAVEQVLNSYGFRHDVEETRIEYREDRKLTHTGTVLAFLEKIARENNLEFWIEYAPVENGAAVETLYKMKASPPRGDAPAEGFALPVLEAEEGRTLQVDGSQDECPNVLSFDLDVDIERASRFFFQAVDEDGKIRAEEATDPQPATGEGGDRLAAIDGIERKQVKTVAGDDEEALLRAEAEATENGWFVEATTSVSLHATRFMLRPHDVVKVEGLGAQYTGAYQVAETVHVLNGTGVLTDAKLRRNVLNEVARA